MLEDIVFEVDEATETRRVDSEERVQKERVL